MDVSRRDLALTLEALCGSSLESIETVDMKFLSYKTALLLALASTKQVADLGEQCALPLSSSPGWL